MSKSKKNVVDPDEIIKDYGADTARLFMISDSPPERDLEWSIEGIKATYKYLKKIFDFLKKDFVFIDFPKSELKKFSEEDMNVFRATQKTIFEFSDDIKNYRFNTAVAKLREHSNNLQRKNISKIVKNYSWSIFLRLISIITPHYSEEIAQKSGFTGFLSELDWPKYDEKFLKEESVKMVVMINCKNRGLIEAPLNFFKNFIIKIISWEKNSCNKC